MDTGQGALAPGQEIRIVSASVVAQLQAQGLQVRQSDAQQPASYFPLPSSFRSCLANVFIFGIWFAIGCRFESWFGFPWFKSHYLHHFSDHYRLSIINKFFVVMPFLHLFWFASVTILFYRSFLFYFWIWYSHLFLPHSLVLLIINILASSALIQCTGFSLIQSLKLQVTAHYNFVLKPHFIRVLLFH